MDKLTPTELKEMIANGEQTMFDMGEMDSDIIASIKAAKAELEKRGMSSGGKRRTRRRKHRKSTRRHRHKKSSPRRRHRR